MSDFLEAAGTRLQSATESLSLEPEMVEFLQKPMRVSQFASFRCTLYPFAR